jgi:Co/Zn/Cd efflux system component
MKTLALVLALIFIVAAILAYGGFAHFSSHLLGFDGGHNTKHAILYAILAILSLLWYRMSNPQPAR